MSQNDQIVCEWATQNLPELTSDYGLLHLADRTLIDEVVRLSWFGSQPVQGHTTTDGAAWDIRRARDWSGPTPPSCLTARLARWFDQVLMGT